MTDDEDQEAFEYTVKMQRGDGTDDRDTHKAKVSAETVDELGEKVENVRQKMEKWAGEFRSIQPDDDSESVAEKHDTFEQFEESES